jgi:hypothetical protein
MYISEMADWQTVPPSKECHTRPEIRTKKTAA